MKLGCRLGIHTHWSGSKGCFDVSPSCGCEKHRKIVDGQEYTCTICGHQWVTWEQEYRGISYPTTEVKKTTTYRRLDVTETHGY